MKKLILFLLLIVVLLQASQAQQVIRVGAFNFYPGIFRDTDGKIKGFYVDALNEIEKRENIKFEYVYGSWSEGLERIKKGEIDMLTSVAYTQDRAQFMDFTSTPLLTVWGEVYVNPHSEIKGVLDLSNKKVAIMKSDFNGEYLKQLTAKFGISCEFIETEDFEQVFKLITTNKVDAGVVNNTFGIPKSESYNLVSSGIIFNPFEIFFTVRKEEHDEIHSLLNKYLHLWIHDRNSVYNVARSRWSHGNVGKMEVFPLWFQNGIYIASGLLLLLISFIVLLRYQVKKATKKLEYSELLFKTFMENIPAFVYIKDRNLNHIYKSKRVEKVNNLTDTNSISSAKTVFDAQTAQMLEAVDTNIFETKIDKNIQYQCELSGQKVWLHDYKFFINLPDGKPAIGGVSFDISNEKAVEEQLKTLLTKLELSNRDLEHFAYVASHDLQEPLRMISSYTQLLERKYKDKIDQNATDYIYYAVDGASRMQKLINDLLEFSRITTRGKEFEQIDTNDVLAQVILNLKLLIDENEASITSGELPSILADESQIVRVFQNLITNAIKFRRKSVPPKIHITCQKTDRLYQFSVHDNGIGIDMQYHERVFTIFQRLHSANEYAGTGIGLSINKRIIERHNGAIWFNSTINVGTTFYFTIPV